MRLHYVVLLSFCWLLGTGCLSIHIPSPSVPDGDLSGALRSLTHAHELFQSGHYAEAEKTYRYVIETHSLDPLAADAQIGLAYTHLYFENPKHDKGKALGEFKAFIKQYPLHPRLNEAKNMVHLLNEFKTQTVEIQQLKDDLKRLIDIDIQTEKKRKETQEEKKELQEKEKKNQGEGQ